MSRPWEGGSKKGSGPERPLDKSPSGDEELAEFFLTPEQKELHEAALREKTLLNQQFERDMRNREEYANKAFDLTVIWVCFILLLTAAQFLKGWVAKMFPGTLGLDPSEFIAVISSTTVTVLGFWLLVGRYLFHRPGVNGKVPKGDE